MTHVVITGGTRGLGLGLARAFVARGCVVTLCGRTSEAVAAALAALQDNANAAPIAGQACDVSSAAQLEALWQMASARAPVDIWINNAGVNASPRPYWEMPSDEVRAMVETNLIGTMQGSLVALRGMRRQGHGSLYNVEGLGADGRARMPGLLSYGASKAGVGYFSRGLASELRGAPVKVCTLDPGIVITAMLKTIYADPNHFGAMRRIIEALAQPVDVVAPRLVERVLSNQRSGVRLRPFGTAHMLWRVLLALVVRRPLNLNAIADE